ncbi:MAG: hypothetical protein LBJ97_02635 [Mycoplasmataceae bacterium]|nr:hypothetical protein [Mycoplasmataceae bacterium]
MPNNNNKHTTPDEIRAMTPEQWQAFRNDSWQKKRELYSNPIPEWYLKDRNSYAQFMDRLNKRKQFVAQGGPSQQKGSLTRKVESLAGDDVDSFANDK